MSLWSFADPQMWVSGAADPSLWADSERETWWYSTCEGWAGHLAGRAVIGQIRRKFRVPSWYSSEFLEDQLASRRCGEDSRPYQQRVASSRHSEHSSCPGRACSRGRKWSQWIDQLVLATSQSNRLREGGQGTIKLLSQNWSWERLEKFFLNISLMSFFKSTYLFYFTWV